MNDAHRHEGRRGGPTHVGAGPCGVRLGRVRPVRRRWLMGDSATYSPWPHSAGRASCVRIRASEAERAEGRPQRSAPTPPTPHRNVKSTSEGNSQFDVLAIHTAFPLIQRRGRCLAAPPGARWHTGGMVPWLERPPAPRAWCGIGAVVFSQLAPRPPGIAPAPSIPAGRRFRAASRRRTTCRPTAGLSAWPASPSQSRSHGSGTASSPVPLPQRREQTSFP